MKIKTIVLFVLSGLLIACTGSSPIPLTVAAISPPANPSHSQTPPPTLYPTTRATQTSAPTLTPTAEADRGLEWIAQTGGSINGITVVGDLAYVGMGPRVAVIDISLHKIPRLVSQSEPLPGLVTRVIQISGQPAPRLLVNAGKYLVLLDLSNPEEIYPIHQLKLTGAITAMAWDDHVNILYSGGSIYQHPSKYTGFISAVDITTDDFLKLINSVAIPETPICLALGEGSIFAGANGEQGGLYRIQMETSGELSTPHQVIASTPEFPLVPSSMRVIGERLYLGYWGVEAYDITNPEQPIKIWAGNPTGLNIATDFTIDGDQVYVTGFSIREPDIQIFGRFSAPDPIGGSPIGKIATINAMHKGDFIVADRSLKIFGAASGQDLQLVGSYLPPVANATHAVANEKTMFVVDIGDGDGLSNAVLWALSLPDLKPLGQVATEIPTSRWNGLIGIALDGDRVYLATADRVWVYDVRSWEPILLGKVDLGGEQLEAIAAYQLDGRRLLLTAQSTEDQNNELKVYDLTNLQKPISLGDQLILAQGFGIHATWNGSALFVLLEYKSHSSPNTSMLSIINYENNVLVLKESLEISGYLGAMAVGEHLIALVGPDVQMGQSLLSLVEPEPAKLVSQTSLPEHGLGLAMIGDRVCVVVGGDYGAAQLLVYDIQDPAHPRQIDALDIAAHINNQVSILFTTPYVVLANGAGGLEVLEYAH